MQFLNKITIQRKLMLACVFISTLPVLLITLLLTIQLYDMSVKKTITLSQSALSQLKENFSNQLHAQADVVDTLTQYTPLRSYLDTHYQNNYESLTDYTDKAYPILSRYSNALTIRLYSNNDSINVSSETNNRIKDLNLTRWYRPEATSPSGYIWSYEQKASDYGRDFLCCYREILDREDYTKIKLVGSVFLPETTLYSLFNQEKDKVVFLCDDRGRILSSTERETVGGAMQGILTEQALPLWQTSNQSEVEYNGGYYVYLSETLEVPSVGVFGWKLIYMVSQQSIAAEYGQIARSSLLLCGLCLTLSLGMIVLISKNITGRLSALVGRIHGVAAGDFSGKLPVEGNDELSQIGNDFNGMVEKIQELIGTIYEANNKIMDDYVHTQHLEMEKKEAEIIALQRQINPHFLFNTLEAIRMNLVIKEERDTARIMQVFAECIREYTGASGECIRMENELLFVKKYILIQQYRFGERVQFEAYIEQELLGLMIPRLMIQPIVENAVFHGLEPKSGHGCIILEIHRKDGRLFITVTDDGVGMEPWELAHLNSLLCGEDNKEHGSTRIGVRNVHNRIRLMYGDEYGLSIKSRKGFGTEIEMILPVGSETPLSGETEDGNVSHPNC